MEFAPELPTLNELGIKDQEAETMTGVFVPSGTPKPIVDLLQTEISAIVNTPEIKARLLELGVVPSGETSQEFSAYVKAEVVKWRKVITEAKIPPLVAERAIARAAGRVSEEQIVAAVIRLLAYPRRARLRRHFWAGKLAERAT